jgi:hypothetical protein
VFPSGVLTRGGDLGYIVEWVALEIC